MKLSKLNKILTEMKGQYRVLTEDEIAHYEKKWLETFAQSVKKQTGEWVYRGYKWHAFSYEYVTAKSGEEAIRLYRAEKAEKYLILPENKGNAYLCDGMELPDVTSFGRDDYYVFPIDFKWTMVFTHEQPELGPYYVRASWLINSPKPRRS